MKLLLLSSLILAAGLTTGFTTGCGFIPAPYVHPRLDHRTDPQATPQVIATIVLVRPESSDGCQQRCHDLATHDAFIGYATASGSFAKCLLTCRE